MSNLHFNNLDLNLLRIFDALLDERSVTRAGARLGMTQSAVSHALNRLRHALDDELFVRTSDGMRPTARAVEIGPAVRAALADLQSALTPQVFDASTAHRRFTLVAGPYTSAVLLPQVAARLREAAPFVQLRLTGPDGRLIENLDAGEVDAALTPNKAFPKRFTYEKLFEETVVWVVRAGHPAARGPVSLEALCDIPHIMVATPRLSPDRPEPDASSSVTAHLTDDADFEAMLTQQGLTRMVAMIVPDTFSALTIVARSDMAALVPRRLAEISVEAGRAAVLDTPYVSPVGEVGLLHRKDRLKDPAQAWFVKLVAETGRDLKALKKKH
ncbi:MAG TPA: LysR family transcriptional regulator [Caulobacteraceae bacterium]|jgi:DNA-binding transcriptional LysR family regulator|nr:LysR family transcriptional regulator [Caulobacteraceae bacterium]